jgi:hypothetical protein
MADIQVNEHWTTRPVWRNRARIKLLLGLLEGRGYIGGSYAAHACAFIDENPIKPNDIDIFATSDDNALRITDTLLNLKHGRIFFVDTINDIVTTLARVDRHGLSMQIIRPSPEWKAFPTDLIDSFDLDVCRAVIISPVEVLCDENAGAKRGKVLRVNNPLRTVKRIMKYSERGVHFNDHELLKVFRAWDEMPAEKKATWIKEAADELLPETMFDSSFTDEDDWFEGE